MQTSALTNIWHEPLLLDVFIYFRPDFLTKDDQGWYTHLHVSLKTTKQNYERAVRKKI